MAKDIYDKIVDTKQNINKNDKKLQKCDTVFDRGEATKADLEEEMFLENKREILNDDYNQLKIENIKKIVGEEFQSKQEEQAEQIINLTNALIELAKVVEKKDSNQR